VSIASDNIALLAAAGVTVRFDDGTLRIVGPEEQLTREVLKWLRWHKDQLQARVTDQPVPSIAYPDMCWHPDGSIGLAHPTDLRELLLAQGEQLGYPAFALVFHPREVLSAGRAAWSAFAASATLGAVGEALLLIDEIAVMPAGREVP
jgi:hypothetical protein